MKEQAYRKLAKGKVDLIATLRNGIRLRYKGILEDIVDDSNETHFIRTEMGQHEFTARAVARYGR